MLALLVVMYLVSPSRPDDRSQSPLRHSTAQRHYMQVSSLLSENPTTIDPRWVMYRPRETVMNDRRRQSSCDRSTGYVKRTNFTRSQKEEMMKMYQRTPYPSLRERELLALKMNTTARKVQIWFQNKRARGEQPATSECR
ncbi:retinal homeobox protein Rx-like [Planoprotostelium fungivorum]|uniref:Retinal homeobox protein Rx-like n=1 Tax=Planoprotostelium fungivorum TaxID=1890364 RepID=A0A2P6NIU5_9EUKA|nr:retinal homeobox protein Rx-like [Planoprotostelium fungivorum]